MPLQNRVDPWGKLVASAAKGTLMGNRGGRFHRDDKTLGRRRWASHRWICLRDALQVPSPCGLMGKGYTSNSSSWMR
jgi:hypothetical protein